MTMLQYIFRAEVLMPLYEEYTKEDRIALLERDERIMFVKFLL